MTDADNSAAKVKKEVKAHTRKLVSLRQQFGELRELVETDSLKLDAVHLKLERVITILTKNLPDALKEQP